MRYECTDLLSDCHGDDCPHSSIGWVSGAPIASDFVCKTDFSSIRKKRRLFSYPKTLNVVIWSSFCGFLGETGRISGILSNKKEPHDLNPVMRFFWTLHFNATYEDALPIYSSVNPDANICGDTALSIFLATYTAKYDTIGNRYEWTHDRRSSPPNAPHQQTQVRVDAPKRTASVREYGEENPTVSHPSGRCNRIS